MRKVGVAPLFLFIKVRIPERKLSMTGCADLNWLDCLPKPSFRTNCSLAIA